MPTPRFLLTLAACGALAACAQAPAPGSATGTAPPMAQPAPPPPPAITRYDGRYSGTATRTSRRSAHCPAASMGAAMTVRDGAASLTAGSGRAGPMEGTVAADGTFSLAGGDARGTGRIARNRVTLQLQGGECSYRVALSKAR